ncbi:MAG TPA: glycosyltransferase family A protein [Vicinamibacterales bacterium]|nr:glycosyltransferase family A protein [Vicinamibacterales bacterium]
MREAPLISVLVTNFNYGPFLWRAIDSVTPPLGCSVELLVVDDGSDDCSEWMIQTLRRSAAERFITFEAIFLPNNYGKMHALNVAVPRLRGQFTVILDADDYLAPPYLPITIAALRRAHAKDAAVQFAYTDCFLVDAEERELGPGRSSPFDAELLRSVSYIPECGPTFTSVLQALLPFDERILSGTKHWKWRKIVDSGWIGVYVPMPLFYYRMHTRNLSGIGARVLHESNRNIGQERLLSGYWRTTNHNQY